MLLGDVIPQTEPTTTYHCHLLFTRYDLYPSQTCNDPTGSVSAAHASPSISESTLRAIRCPHTAHRCSWAMSSRTKNPPLHPTGDFTSRVLHSDEYSIPAPEEEMTPPAGIIQ